MGLASLTLVLGCAALGTWTQVSAQVGLRRSPIDSPRIRHGSHDDHDSNESSGRIALGLFSKWAAMDLAQRKSKPGVMDSQLEGIFRGVAYGVTTDAPTTPIPASTTTIASTTASTTIRTTTVTTTTTTPTTTPSTTSKTPDPTFLDSTDVVLDRIHPEDNHEDWQLIREPSTLPVWPRKEERMSSQSVSSIPSQEPPVQYPYMDAPIRSTIVTTRNTLQPTSRYRDVEVVWSDVKQLSWIRSLGIFWEIHVYIAAGFYVILMLLAVICLARTKSHVHLITEGYYITLHLLLFLAAFLRSVPLFHDPYGVKQRLPKSLSQAVEETAWPCLTAALGVVTIALIKAWSCPRTMHKYTYAPVGLAVITAIHLVMVLTAHLAAALIPIHAAPLHAAGQSITVAWGCTVGLCGLVAMLRVGRSWGKLHNQLLLKFNKVSSQSTNATHTSTTVLILGTRLTFLACLAQMTLVALHLYLLLEPNHVLNLPPVYPWQWLVFQSSMKSLEIFAWILLITVSVLNASSSRKCVDSSGETKLLTVLGCHCCGTSSSVTMQDKGHDIFPVLCHTDQINNQNTNQSPTNGLQEDLSMNSVIRRVKTEIKHGRRNPVRRSATLHGNPSDIILPSINANVNARPSSVIFDDSGFIRFKIQDDSIVIPKEFLNPSLQHIPNISVEDHSNKSINHQIHEKGNNILLNNERYESPLYDNINVLSSPNRMKDNESSESFVRTSADVPYTKAQNKIDSELYAVIANLIGKHEDALNIADISSSDAMSPPPPSDLDESKYAASTCSSISAANSFDVCMYDDFELAHYYHNPSIASTHTYASLNSSINQVYPNRSVIHKENLRRDDLGYGSQSAIEQFGSLLTSQNSRIKQMDEYSKYYTDGSVDQIAGTSDSDIYDSNQSYEDESSPLPNRLNSYLYRGHNRFDITQDSGLAVDSSGITDEASGEDSESSTQSPLFNKRQGLFSKVVRKNLTLNNDGYYPLKGEELSKYQQLHNNHQHFLQNPLISNEGLRNNSPKPIHVYDSRSQNTKKSETSFTQPDSLKINSKGQRQSFSERCALKEKQRLFLQQQLQQRIKEEKIRQQIKEKQVYEIEEFKGEEIKPGSEALSFVTDNTNKSDYSNSTQKDDVRIQPSAENHNLSLPLQAKWGDTDNNNWSKANIEDDIMKTDTKSLLNCTKDNSVNHIKECVY